MNMTRPVTPTRSPDAESIGRSAYLIADVAERIGAVEYHRVGGNSIGEHPRALLAPDPHLLGKVFLFRGRGHGRAR